MTKENSEKIDWIAYMGAVGYVGFGAGLVLAIIGYLGQTQGIWLIGEESLGTIITHVIFTSFALLLPLLTRGFYQELLKPFFKRK